MSDIKGFLLNFSILFLFSLAFFLIFIFFTVSNAINEINTLEQRMLDAVPEVIKSSSGLRQQLDSSLEEELADLGDEQTFQLQVEYIKSECQTNKESLPEAIQSSCPDFVENRINSKQDFKESAINRYTLPKISKETTTQLQNMFFEIKETLAKSRWMENYSFFGALLIFLTASTLSYTKYRDINITINDVMWHSFVQGILYVLPFLLLLSLQLFGIKTSDITLGIIKNNFASSQKDVFSDDYLFPEIIKPITEITIEWIDDFMMKMMNIFIAITIVGLLGWYVTRHKNVAVRTLHE